MGDPGQLSLAIPPWRNEYWRVSVLAAYWAGQLKAVAVNVADTYRVLVRFVYTRTRNKSPSTTNVLFHLLVVVIRFSKSHKALSIGNR